MIKYVVSLFYICLLFCSLSCKISFAQEKTISKVADKITDELCKKKYLKQIGNGKKITVYLFLEKDTVKTFLGIELAKQVAISLNSKLKDTAYKIFIPKESENKFLKAAMYRTWTPPNSNSEESKYWREKCENEKPDYWLTGEYRLSDDKKNIIIKNIYLKHNEFDVNKNSKDFVTIDLSYLNVSVNPQEQNSIAELNKPINNVSGNYLKLIYLEGKADLFTIDEITDYKLKKAIDAQTPLKIGNDYEIKITIKEKAYLYGFYYDPKDKEHNFFDMLHPLDKNNKPFEAGTYKLPDNDVINIEKPEGEAYIMFIASTKLIPVTFSSFKGSDGYNYTYFKDENCKLFLEQIAKLSPADYDAKNIIKKVIY